MKMKFINLFIILVAIVAFASISISTPAFGQDKYSVSGEISFQEEKGQLCVWLRTQEEHELFSKPATPARILIIKPTPQQLQTKKASFKFVAVPKGSYSIFCLQDLNGNGKQDRSPQTGRPTETHRYSVPVIWHAQWDEIKFEVDKDVSGIEIKF